MSKKPETVEIPARKNSADLTPAERERITVVSALRMAGSIILRGPVETIATAMTLAATPPADFVSEIFVQPTGWTLVQHQKLEKAS